LLGFLLLVVVYAGISTRLHWKWKQGVQVASVFLFIASVVWILFFNIAMDGLYWYWNPRYVGPFISVFEKHEDNKPNDKNSTSEVFLQAIAHAIKFRKVTNAKDCAYALYGILRGQGARLSKPDYQQTESTVYYYLYCDLISWDRASLVFLMDAGITGMPGKLSWVPDRKEAASRSWLPLNIYTSRPRSEKARKLLDQARSMGGGDEILARVDGGTLEVLVVIVACVKTCFGPPSRLDDGSVEMMLAGTARPGDDSTRQEDSFDTDDDDERSNAEGEFSNLCRLYSSNEPSTPLRVVRRRLMAIRRDLADFCHWTQLARNDSPCTPAYYSVPQAIFEVLQAKRLTTQFRRKWDGAVLADGSNIDQLFDIVPEPVPEGFQRLYLSISTHLGQKAEEIAARTRT
jgi:hypothetical protein